MLNPDQSAPKSLSLRNLLVRKARRESGIASQPQVMAYYAKQALVYRGYRV